MGTRDALVLNARWCTCDPDGFGYLCDRGFQIGGDDLTWNEVTGESDVDGRSAIVVAVEDEDGNPGTVEVATDAPHHALRLTSEGGTDLTFSEFDQPVKVEVPPAHLVLDTAKLND